MPGLPFRNRSDHSLATVFSWFPVVLACNSLKFVEDRARLSQCGTGMPLWPPLRLSTEFPIFTEHTLTFLLTLVNSASGPRSESHFPYTAHPSSPIGHWNTLVVACPLLAGSYWKALGMIIIFPSPNNDHVWF